MRKVKIWGPAALALVLLCVGVAACGGGGGSSSASTEATGESTSSDASATTVPQPPEAPPAEFPGQKTLKPLPEPPPKTTVAALQCDLSACKGFIERFKEAGSALGWTVKTSVFKTGSPQSAITSAVNSPGTKYIVLSGGTSREEIEPQLKEAQAKGISIVACCALSEPDPAAGWPVMISNGYGNAEKQADALARWMINDSEGDAHAVVIGFPEAAIIRPTPPAIEKTFQESCPECSATELAVTGEEIAAGTVPSRVVAYLQGHPDVNYVSASFGNLVTGVPAAIKSAGLADKVKVVGQQELEPGPGAELKSGAISAWMTAGVASVGYFWADAIARLEENLPLPQKVYEIQPANWLVTPATAEEGIEWAGPAELKEFFFDLWKVGG